MKRYMALAGAFFLAGCLSTPPVPVWPTEESVWSELEGRVIDSGIDSTTFVQYDTIFENPTLCACRVENLSPFTLRLMASLGTKPNVVVQFPQTIASNHGFDVFIPCEHQDVHMLAQTVEENQFLLNGRRQMILQGDLRPRTIVVFTFF